MVRETHTVYITPDEPAEVVRQRVKERTAKAHERLSKLTDEEIMARIKYDPGDGVARETASPPRPQSR
jgi:peptide subunit release factor 1 (eRF1)